MIIDDALNMAYSYAATICQDSELCKVSQEFNGLAGETERTYITKSTTITSYSDIQNLLSKLNEKESVRKSKGVYYTPYDVVRFIVINSVKSAYGKLTPENIRREDIDTITISGQVVRLVWDVYLIEMACLYMKMVKSI